MGTLLDQWLGPTPRLRVVDEGSISEVREAVRTEGALAGLPGVATEALATAAGELARNQLLHARGGEVAVRRVLRDGASGVELVAADRGPGLADPAGALSGRQAGTGLGFGLSSARRLSDEMDVDVRLGEGACFWLRKFGSPPLPRRELAVLGRPYPGESVSGDHAGFRRDARGLLACVVDGLGHGPAARAAADAALRLFAAAGDAEPGALVERCHEALTGTRGAVMAAMRLDRDRLTHAVAGNVSIVVQGPEGSLRPRSDHRVLGARGRGPAFREGHLELPRRPLLVAFTDGLQVRLDLDDDPGLREQHPLVIAQRLLERFSRPDDDALVLVATG